MAKALFEPWKPVDYELADAYAVRALYEGTADECQQKRALKWIIENACCVNQQAFLPNEDGRRNTDFMLGRIFAGQQIVKMIKLNTNVLANEGKK